MGRAMVDHFVRVFPAGSQTDHARYLTTRSTRSMVGSSCGCSMPITTNTAFSRSSCSMAKVASSLPFFVPPNGPAARRLRAFLRRLLRAIRANWPKTEILLRADEGHCCSPEVFSTDVGPTVSITSWASRATTTLRRHIGDLEASTKARFEDAPNNGKARHFKEFLDGAASLEPRRAPHRPRRSRCGRDRLTLHRHQSRHPQCARALGGCLLPAWPGRKSHEILEDASGGGPHLLHQSHGQPVAAVPARGRILAHVGPARVDAQTFDGASRSSSTTLRLRLIKIAARVVEMKTMIRVHLQTSCPAQDILRLALGRIPRLVT